MMHIITVIGAISTGSVAITAVRPEMGGNIVSIHCKTLYFRIAKHIFSGPLYFMFKSRLIMKYADIFKNRLLSVVGFLL